MNNEIIVKLNKTTLSHEVKVSDNIKALETLEVEFYQNTNKGIALVKATKKNGASKEAFKEEVLKAFEEDGYSDLDIQRENDQAIWFFVSVLV